MVLNQPGLFGSNHLFDSENKTKFDFGIPHVVNTAISAGWSATGHTTFEAAPLGSKINISGFITAITFLNESGAPRNVDWKVENITTGETLRSGSVSASDSEKEYINFWSLEYIKPGDQIKLSITGDGVGTSIENSTKYYSLPGMAFRTDDSWDEYELYEGEFKFVDSCSASTPVSLPHGAVVTNAIVYGSDSSEEWRLKRCSISDGGSDIIMASGAMRSADSTINYATIDNNNYSYIIDTTSQSVGDKIEGARITYTLADQAPAVSGYFQFKFIEIYEGQDESS